MNWFSVYYCKPLHNYLFLLITLYIYISRVEVECRLIRVKRTGPPWRSTNKLFGSSRKMRYRERLLQNLIIYTTREPELFDKVRVHATSKYKLHPDTKYLHLLMNYEVPMVVFNNRQKYPIIGLGTWKSKPGEVKQAVMDAINAGYRHIDTAYVYQNEKEIGEGINQKLKEGAVKREDLYITTKLWNTDHREDLVYPALMRSLKNLNLEYVDLYLIHWPMGYKEGDELFPVDENNKTLYSETDFVDTWRAMEDLVRRKLVGSIGVSNFSSAQILEVLKIAKIKPVTNQIECHPYLNQKKMREFCKEHGMVLTAYSPLGSPDRPWAKPDELPMLEMPELRELALKYDKTPAQIVLRWQIEHGNIVIPKSVTKSRIISNFDIFSFQLQKEDIDFLDSLDCNQRLVGLEWIADHKDYPFKAEY